MRVVFTYRRAGSDAVDLAVTLDGATNVGDLAVALQQRDPRAGGSAGREEVTLELVGTERVRLDPAQLVADSGLVSGTTVALSPRGRDSEGPTGVPAAVVRILEGPDSGRVFRLGRGTSLIGRTTTCEVRLADTSVSREHARLNVSDVAEVVDLVSSNGIMVDGGQVSKAVLRPRDQVRLGDTVLTVEVADSAASSVTGTSHLFNRAPRLDPTYEGRETVLPEPPERQQEARLPVIALIAPLLFGALLFLITRSPTSLVFVAISPVMALGNVVESRRTGRRTYRGAVRAWQLELDDITDGCRAELAVEAAGRRREHPSADEVRTAALARADLLWTRRPAAPRFLELRLGLAAQPSRCTVVPPTGRRAEAESSRKLQQLVNDVALVTDVPVVGALGQSPLGLTGPRSSILNTARAVVTQVVGLHSPAEVVLAAALNSDSVVDWQWLAWLPHTSSPHSPIGTAHLAANPGAVSTLISQLEELVDARVSTDAASLPAVVLLVEDAATTDRPRLVALAERGSGSGVHIIWLAPSVDRLPAACATYLDVAATGPSTVGFAPDRSVSPVVVERLDAADALALARDLSPVVDSGASLEDDTDLPRTVPWLALHDTAVAVQADAILERWQESRSLMTGPFARPPRRGKPGSLRATLGQSAGQVHTLDLRRDGPHALVGGTTGSGKSELLQSWILGLAATHSPQRVTFLLVDYKGGSAFRECLDLPHTVGLVTDLSPHLVRRALTSLSAELRHREELLARKKRKDLLELEERGDPDAPPSLVIVVDEFAALVQEVPEFVDGVVNVAQRGRSLGLHLILATQRPAGVIKGNLRANTNLRIALRVADEDDSTDVIGTPQAAGFDPALPGRAVSKTGPGRLVPFQSAYAGGWTTDTPSAPGIDIEEMGLGVRRAWNEAEESEVVAPSGPPDIARVVQVVKEAARRAELPAARKPWLSELVGVQELSDLPTARRDDVLVFGTVDRPERQSQPTIAFHPDRDGNLAVYGTGGSGKSGLLRSIAVAAGFTYRGGPCRVYGLDFGARGLAMLATLPHVGSIIPGADHERLTRLLGELRRLIDERAGRYAAASAGTITEYRELARAPNEHRLLLLVDGIGAFRSAYEGSDRVRWFDLFQSLASDGRPVGVHVVLSADRPAAVPSSLGSAVQARVVLRLADEGDYSTLAQPADVLGPASGPGRGLVDGAEVQVAILGGSLSTLDQAHAIAAVAAAMRRAGVPDAPAIERLREVVTLDELPVLTDGTVSVALGAMHLGPVGLDPHGCFIITGPPGSGRTTALQTVLAAVLRQEREHAVHYVGNRRSVVSKLPLLASVATSAADAAELAARLLPEVGRPDGPRLVLVLEGVGDYLNSAADLPLQQLVRALLAEDHLVVCEGETSSLAMGSSLLTLLKAGRTGLALQPESAEASVFRSEFPRLRRADLPAGRGMLVTAGRAQLVQVALPPSSFGVNEGSAPPTLVSR